MYLFMIVVWEVHSTTSYSYASIMKAWGVELMHKPANVF